MQAIETVHRVALKNILVATDFSDNSKRALEYARAFACRYDSQLHLAHVFNTDAYVIGAAEASSMLWMEEAKKGLNAELDRLAAATNKAGISTDCFLAEGQIGRQIRDLVTKHDIDLVVVGTHGGGPLNRLLIGSAAEAIFREVTCPVLTVGPRVFRHPKGGINFRHILYATDFTPESAQAAPLALSLAEEYGARVTLVHVMPADMVSISEVRRHSEYYNEELRKLVPADAERWCRPRFLLEYGSAPSAITDFATGNSVDLIVMGAKRGSSITSHLVGGTAYKVVCNAECPVLTVGGGK